MVAAQPVVQHGAWASGTAYSASTALYVTGLGQDEIRACAVLGTGADLHDGWVYASGAFELGWNVYWAYMTLAESIARLDVPAEERTALAADYADAIRQAPAVLARLPISDHPLLERGGDHQFREWLDHGLRRLLARRRRARRPVAAARADALDRRLVGQLPQVAPTCTAGSQAPAAGSSPWEHTNHVSPFSTSRTGAVELGPDAACGVGLSTPLVLDWMDRWLLGRDAGAAGGVRYWQHGANEWRGTAGGRRRMPSIAGTLRPGEAG